VAGARAKTIEMVELKPEPEIGVPVPQSTALVCGASKSYK